MPLRTGNLSIDDLLANRFISPAAYGLSTIQEVLDRDLATHNAIIRSAASELVDITSDKQRISGTSSNGSGIEVDEFGRAPTQKMAPGSTVGFPMRKYQYSIGWDSEYMKLSTVADMASQQVAAEKWHARTILANLKRAIYTPTDSTFRDWLSTPSIDLAVKQFLNADGDAVPEGPNGEVFATSHTHYVGATSMVASDVTAIINTVVEHGYGEGLKLFINVADEAAIRAMTPTFSPFIDSRQTLNANAIQPMERLDVTVANNRPIGYFGAATVWVKPWALQNYFFAAATGTGSKPLVMRERDGDVLNGLRRVAQNDAYPLHAEFLEAVYGIGVWNRANGAVLFNGNSTYQAPTITNP
jgi:hypothetical protein